MSRRPPAPSVPREWGLAAEREVAALRAELPPDVRAHADRVAVRFEDRVSRFWRDEGIEGDTVGLFSGPSLRDPDAAECDEAPLVTLFLGPLAELAGGDFEAFLEEVRRTYLHELGHYLGLEEEDMPGRDLD